MRRRYRGGVALGKEEFAAQPWAQGMLFLQTVESRPQLGLYEANVPGHQTPPLGILWRPELTACFNDSISFAGFEKVDKRWCYQVWYCETRSAESGNVGATGVAVSSAP